LPGVITCRLTIRFDRTKIDPRITEITKAKSARNSPSAVTRPRRRF
jgi:hypothetical protein